MTTTFDVSAHFGGRDAAQALLPHFRALKSAIKGRLVGGFPFRELTFILRVGGEVSAFGPSGSGNVDVDRMGKYVSVDLVVARADWVQRGVEEISVLVSRLIRSTIDLLREAADARLAQVDWNLLGTALDALADAYRAELVPRSFEMMSAK